MIQQNLYLFEVYINKCIISAGQQGDLSLFMRIGKTVSSFIKAKSYDNKTISFQSNLKCNCDQNALQTKRFSITLNIKSPKKENKIIGIAMIQLQNQSSNQLKTYKISQTKDNQASIQLRYSVTLIDGNNNMSKKGSGQNGLLTPKKSQTSKKSKQNIGLLSPKSTQLKKQKSLFDTLISTPKINRLPSSQFIQEINTTKKYELQNQDQNERTKLKNDNQSLVKQNEKLRKQKQFLRQLLKLEMNKNRELQNFMRKTHYLLTQSKMSQILNSRQKICQQNIQKLKESMDSLDKANTQIYGSIGSIGQNSNITSYQQNGVKSRIQFKRNEKNNQSKLSLSRISNISQQLSLLLKDSVIKQRQESKKTISQLKKVIMDESNIKTQRKLRSVKLKLQKSYIQLLKQQQPYNKQQILKHKIGVNKILDQLILCTISE